MSPLGHIHTHMDASTQHAQMDGQLENNASSPIYCMGYYNYTRLTASFSRTIWVSWYQKGKPVWI